MALPVVAIVGRPNVGKSSLFNMLAGARTSIVEPTAGVTRDRVTTICEIDSRYFELVDTGGHGIVDRDDLNEHVERQIEFAVDQAHLILFVVDVREGLMPLDVATAEMLRRHQRVERTRLVANKMDDLSEAAHRRRAWDPGEFVRLGFGEPIVASALHGHGRSELREVISKAVSGVADDVPAEPVMKIALVGKRNAGKSTFINALAGEQRVIVSEIPGTTRDSIDVRIEKDGRTVLLIDTAGVRKKRKVDDSIEFFARARAVRSIRRADVVLFLIDAAEPVGQADKQLAHIIAEEYRPCVLVVNKWDLAKGRASTDDYGEYLGRVLTELRFAPIVFTTATAGKNTLAALDVASLLLKQSRTRVGTGRLNKALEAAVAATAPRVKKGAKPARLYYATQVSTHPPTIVIFVNEPSRLSVAYERYLVNRFRETLPFAEVPIRLVFRARRGRSTPPVVSAGG